MEKSIKHHFLPRTILRRFANKKELLFVYDKEAKREWLSNIINAGMENDYNTVSIGNTKYNLEDTFSSYDSTLGKTVDKIIKNGNLSCLDEMEYQALYFLVIVQLARSPIFRSTVESTSKQLSDILAKFDNNFTNYRPDKERIKFFSLNDFDKHVISIYSEINSKKITLIKDAKDRFITSDNCVVYDTVLPYEFPSLSEYYTIIIFPISSSLLLLFSTDTALQFLFGSEKYSTNENCIDDKFVLAFNKMQLFMSKRFLYSKHSIEQYFNVNHIPCVEAATRTSTIGKIENFEPMRNVKIPLGKILVINVDNTYYPLTFISYKVTVN
jgi:hypothetical protein